MPDDSIKPHLISATCGLGKSSPILIAALMCEDFQQRRRRSPSCARWSNEVTRQSELGASDLDLPTRSYEGRELVRKHLIRERDPLLRARKVKQARAAHGSIACEVCEFDFEEVYGKRGRNYIECHHRVPLSVSGETITSLDDLALLCSNCHRMIHRQQPWMTVEGLRQLLQKQRCSSTDP